VFYRGVMSGDHALISTAMRPGVTPIPDALAISATNATEAVGIPDQWRCFGALAAAHSRLHFTVRSLCCVLPLPGKNPIEVAKALPPRERYYQQGSLALGAGAG